MKKLNILLFLSTVLLITVIAVVGNRVVQRNNSKRNFYFGKDGLESYGELIPKTLNQGGKDVIDYNEKLKRSPDRLADLMLEKKRVLNVVYIEVNDVNPLNCLEFRYADTNEPFFDVVILFADNFVWSHEKNKAVIKHNSNVKAILDNKEKYIEPLQAEGIKVVVDYLPDHSGLGYYNLNDKDIDDLSDAMVEVVRKYNLDGLDFDEEYADYHKLPSKPSVHNSMSKLVYALRKKLPDKIISVFDWALGVDFSVSQSFGEVGFYMDFAYHGSYGGYKNNSIIGLDNKFYGSIPEKVVKEFPNFKGITLSQNAKIALGDGGYKQYGIHMFFNLRETTKGDALSKISEITFGRPIVRSDRMYAQEWIAE